MNDPTYAVDYLPRSLQNPDDIPLEDVPDSIISVGSIITATRLTLELDFVRATRALQQLEHLKRRLEARLLDYYSARSGRRAITPEQYEAENGPIDPEVILAAAEHPQSEEENAAFSLTGAIGKTGKYVVMLRDVYELVLSIINVVSPVTGVKTATAIANASFDRNAQVKIKSKHKPDILYTALFTKESLALVLHETRSQDQQEKGVPVEKDTINDIPVATFLQKKEDENAPENLKEKSGYIMCTTQTQESIASLIVGGIKKGTIHLWENSTVLSWRLIDETFETQEQFTHSETAMLTATAAWNKIKPGDITFTRAASAEEATFKVKFEKKKGTVAAKAFFPAEYVKNVSSITILPISFMEFVVKDLAKILCHELGHVLGFRHEFALEKERAALGGRFGAKDPLSAMSYNHPPILSLRDVTTSRSVYQHFQGGGEFELPDGKGRKNKFTVTRVDPTAN